MRRHLRRQTEEPGQDSFLDVVANLVGILIILVMVVGASAKVAWVAATSEQDKEELKRLKLSVAQSRNTAASLESDNHDVEAKIDEQEAAIMIQRSVRDQLLLFVSEIQHRRDEKLKNLNDNDAAEFRLKQQLAAASAELDDIERKRHVAENSAAPVAVIEHLPTPMAKTVFGKEVHFRLLDGRIVFVPLEELIEKMRNEFQVKAQKLRDAPQTIETVSPIGDFRLRYLLQKKQQQSGLIKQQIVSFEGFELIPVREPLGEPLEQALQPGSRFQRLIETLNPEATTITIWVYPDSFNEFLALKRHLFDRGFLTASWPLPEGQPISGGPNGRRSTAQ